MAQKDVPTCTAAVSCVCVQGICVHGCGHGWPAQQEGSGLHLVIQDGSGEQPEAGPGVYSQIPMASCLPGRGDGSQEKYLGAELTLDGFGSRDHTAPPALRSVSQVLFGHPL